MAQLRPSYKKLEGTGEVDRRTGRGTWSRVSKRRDLAPPRHDDVCDVCGGPAPELSQRLSCDGTVICGGCLSKITVAESDRVGYNSCAGDKAPSSEGEPGEVLILCGS